MNLPCLTHIVLVDAVEVVIIMQLASLVKNLEYNTGNYKIGLVFDKKNKYYLRNVRQWLLSNLIKN